MRTRGFSLSVLQPFDPAFYERLGYKTYSWLNRIELSAERLNNIGRTAETIEPDPERLAEQYSAFTTPYDGCSLRDKEYFKGFIDEFGLQGARLVTTPYGCCAGYEEGESFMAYELFSKRRDPESLLALLPRGYKSVTFFLPEDIELSGMLLLTGGFSSFKTVPFCMAARLADGVSFGEEAVYCSDRY